MADVGGGGIILESHWWNKNFLTLPHIYIYNNAKSTIQEIFVQKPTEKNLELCKGRPYAGRL